MRIQFYLPTVFETGELGNEIVDYLDFESLHNLSKICIFFCTFIAGVHRRAYIKMLRPYAIARVLELCDIIGEVNGVLTGSSALSLFMRLDAWKPNDLNIVTPQGNSPRLRQFLLDIGYTIPKTSRSNAISPEMSSVVSSHETFHHRSSIISVTESIDNSVLTVVLSSIATQEMIFATPDGLFCAHPRLTLQLIALHGFPRPLGTKYKWKAKRYNQMNFKANRNTANWEKECGRDCPVNWHNISNPKDALILDWNRISPLTTVSMHSPYKHIQNHRLYWRLGHRCQNMRCLSKQYEIPSVIGCASHWEEINHIRKVIGRHPVRNLQSS
jgi:hypothetical protein